MNKVIFSVFVAGFLLLSISSVSFAQDVAVMNVVMNTETSNEPVNIQEAVPVVSTEVVNAVMNTEPTDSAPAADAIKTEGAVAVPVVAEAVKTEGIDPSAMTEEQKAAQARMKEYSTTNENHEFLKSIVGTWKTNVKFWMASKGPAEESEGTSEAKMILGGRFLEQTFNGLAMGQPFEGRGFLGYDNLRKEYTGIWLDNMSTGIMTSSGKYDPATKTIAEEGSLSCPITNETHRWYRAVTTLTDADHYTYETFMKDKDGTEYRSMIISYTRVL